MEAARLRRGLRVAENSIAFASLLLLVLFPLVEVFTRKVFQSGVHGSFRYIQHLVVWVTFTGGMITSREGKHLSLAAGFEALNPTAKRWVGAVVYLVATIVGTALTWSAYSFLLLGFDPESMIGIVPIKIAVMVMPIGYLIITLRFIFNKTVNPRDRWIPAVGLLIGTIVAVNSVGNVLYEVFDASPEFIFSISDFVYRMARMLKWPTVIGLIGAAVLGAPLFVVLGGIAVALFSSYGGSFEVIPNEAYSMLISHTIPAIPLFTVAGFVLSESKAGNRLVRLFQAFFGWLPGGMAIAAVVVCAFFTTFTGASGVTILALGGLLYFVLTKSGNKPGFTSGLLTASGSIGLLLPPSLPIILYGVVAQTNIQHMFLGGILPGVLMIVALSVMGISSAAKNRIKATPFRLREAWEATREAVGEILLPVVILVAYFSGLTTLVEAAAVAVLYIVVLEVFIHRDIAIRNLGGTVLKAVPVIGGVLIILTVARGLSYYLVDAEVPFELSRWVEANISSKYAFLILLNLALLVTGCLMDIFSAIVVVAPLVIPLGEVFGIHPVHLGIIFLANLELGYLTPPVGLNLFLSSYRFNEPLAKIYKHVLPFFFVLLVTVLLVTYVPWFSLIFVPAGG